LSHLSEVEIARFLTSRAAPWERQRVVRHLLAGCGICSRKLVERAPGRLLDEAEEARRGKASRDLLRNRAVATALEQDSRWRSDEKKLKQSLELLDRHPQGYDGLTFRKIQPLQGKPLVEALLQKSWDARFRDPKEMRWLAYNALKAAESLRPEKDDPAILLDLQARSWADLANAYKINDEYAEAEGALARARDLLRRGSGDPFLLTAVAQKEASLLSYQRRGSEAREVLNRIHRLCFKLGDRHLAGEILISQGVIMDSEDAPRQAVLLFRQALALLDADRDSQSVAIGQQCLITALVGSGEYLRQRLNDNIRIRWLEGRLLAGLGQWAKGEGVLRTVRDELLCRGDFSSAADVALHLLPILTQQAKYSQARRVANEAYTFFWGRGFRRDAAKAKHYLL
jgi:tetratricopeptide (TPR) repeat protein